VNGTKTRRNSDGPGPARGLPHIRSTARWWVLESRIAAAAASGPGLVDLLYVNPALGHADRQGFSICSGTRNPNDEARPTADPMAQPPTASPLFGTVPKDMSSFIGTFQGHDFGVYSFPRNGRLDLAQLSSIKFATGGNLTLDLEFRV